MGPATPAARRVAAVESWSGHPADLDHRGTAGRRGHRLFFEPGLIDTSFNTSDEEVVTEDADSTITSVVAESRLLQPVPTIPDILGVASPIYELRVPEGRIGPFEFTLRLTNPTQDGRNLGAYTWNGEDWVAWETPT